MGELVKLEDAQIEPSLKVCCKDIAADIQERKVMVYKNKFKRLSTINGGPSYLEVYTMKIMDGDKELTTCNHCGKDLSDDFGRLTIKYLAQR